MLFFREHQPSWFIHLVFGTSNLEMTYNFLTAVSFPLKSELFESLQPIFAVQIQVVPDYVLI